MRYNYTSKEDLNMYIEDLEKLLKDAKSDIKQSRITKEAYHTTMLNTPIKEYREAYKGYAIESIEDALELINDITEKYVLV